MATGGGPGATGGYPGATGGAPSPDPYVLDPTLPVDPSCTCETSDKICNAARECVPRCDEEGRCARWLAERPVVDMFVEGSTLFYIIGPSTDPLGNPSTNGSLYRVDTSGGSPTLISASLGNPSNILGRRDGVTYLETTSTWEYGSIVSIDDSGTVKTVLGEWGRASVFFYSHASMRDHWIAWANRGASTLMGVDLEGDLQPVVLAEAPPENSGGSTVGMPMVLDDVILYETKDKDSNAQMCSLQLANLASGPSCEPFIGALDAIASANQYYVWQEDGGFVESYAPPATRLLRLHYVTNGYVTNVVYANGWLYINVLIASASSTKTYLVRAPTTVGRNPQPVLPQELVTRITTTANSAWGLNYAVGETDLFWIQPQATEAQYIFSAPLPPQPCDAELPCADTSLICNDGLCGPA